MKKRFRRWFLFLTFILLTQTAVAEPTFEADARPILKKYCFSCHGKIEPEGSLDLSKIESSKQALGKIDLWKNVQRKILSGAMPPEEKPRLVAGDQEKLIGWINSVASTAPLAVTMRRLNRSEYTNTIRDLLRIDPGKVEEFPSDDVGYGFDTIGDVLSTSPLLLEKYLACSERFAYKAIIVPGTLESSYIALNFEPKKIPVTDGAKVLSTEGQLTLAHNFQIGGDFQFVIKATGDQAGEEPCKAGITIDDKLLINFEVPAVSPQTGAYTVTVPIKKGYHKIGISFLNDFYDPNFPDPKKRDRNLAIAGLSIYYPQELVYSTLPESHRKIITKPIRTEEDFRPMLMSFSSRAFRRPATDEEVERLMKLIHFAKEQGEGDEMAMVMAVSAILVSPHFLYRPEIDPSPENSGKKPLNGYELASRLSYFLWSSMPDETLFFKADNGSLLKPSVLEKEIDRMLADKKSKALINDFFFQWLTLRQLEDVSPNRKLFTDWSPQLKKDMATETALFISNLIAEDLPLTDLISGKYSFVNDRLGKLYEVIPGSGENFVKVDLSSTSRFGILNQPSVMTITSHPSRTSPVKRGKWLLEEILGTPPPPPPPDVGALVEDTKSSEPKTLRARLEAHRANTACAVCHNKIDPLGFALENFDAIGRYRTMVGKETIDTSGVMPSGKAINGPTDLSEVLLADKKNFIHNLVEKLMIYALGRGTGPGDEKLLNDMTQKVLNSELKVSSLIYALVTSEAFMTRGQGK